MLKQNGRLIFQMPLRHRGGASAIECTNYGRGERMNQSVGEGMPSKLAGAPNGHLAPSSWILPMKPGGMSAYTGGETIITNPAAQLIEGRPISGAADIWIDNPAAAGQLIVTTTGTADIWVVNNPASLAGALYGSGTADIWISNTGTLGGIVYGSGTADVWVSNPATIRADGFMQSGSEVGGALTTSNVGAAVFQAMASNGITFEQIIIEARKAAKLAAALSA